MASNLELGGPPKLSQFVWCACLGALATKDRLRERHIIEDGEREILFMQSSTAL